MQKLVEKLASKAVEKNIIAQEQAEWFRYGIEKRLSSIAVGIPCFTLAVILSDFWGALTFNISFFSLRKYTNGFHATTVWGCLLSSLFCELVFLGILYPLLEPAFILVGIVLSLIAVFSLAPYDHPHFGYTYEELTACKKAARTRVTVLSIFALAGTALQITPMAKGISLGCAMAGSLLCFAYLFDRRKTHGKQGNKAERDSQQGRKRNDGL